MVDAFVSYSRRDGDFVHKLQDALAAAQKNVWVDWEDIARGENWWKEIQTGIEGSDTTLIVVSEHWLLSEICHRELDYVRANNKRVFPIIRQQIKGDVEIQVKGTWVDQDWEQRARDNWKYLRSLNWLFFDDDTKFEAVFSDLITALDSDQPHIKAHTRYQVRAVEWEQSQHNPSFLLEGDDLAYAERWLTDSAGKQPEPTQVQQNYIAASRETANTKSARETARERQIQQSRRAAVVLGIVGLISVVAVLAAIPISVNAVNSNATSVAQVAIAGATLSPVPPTLTAVAQAVERARAEQDIALAMADASLDLSRNELDSAILSGEYLVEAYPDQPLAYLSNAIILAEAGETEQAIDNYSKAIKLDPDYVQAYYNRGSEYWVLGNTDEVLADYTRALELDPAYAAVYFDRGILYVELGMLDEALADFSNSIIYDPDLIDAYQERGYANYLNNDYPAALADWATFEEMGGELTEEYLSLRTDMQNTLTATPSS